MKKIMITLLVTIATLSSFGQIDFNKELSKNLFVTINDLRVKSGNSELEWSEKMYVESTMKLTKKFIKGQNKVHGEIMDLPYVLLGQCKEHWSREGTEGAISIITDHEGEYYYYFIVN